MIVQWFISMAQGFASWVASLVPPVTLPDQIVHLDSTVNGVFSTYGAGLAPVADWSFVALCITLPLSVWAAALLVRAVRALIAHLPYIGGKG